MIALVISLTILDSIKINTKFKGRTISFDCYKRYLNECCVSVYLYVYVIGD